MTADTCQRPCCVPPNFKLQGPDQEQPSQLIHKQLHDALVEELLQAGPNAAALQTVLAGCAAAVLRLGQALPQGPAQQQLIQGAVQAMQDAPETLLHTSRDMQLLQLVQGLVSRQGQQQLGTAQDGQCWTWAQECPEAAQAISELSGMVDSQPQ
jgi:hypothetical protein